MYTSTSNLSRYSAHTYSFQTNKLSNRKENYVTLLVCFVFCYSAIIEAFNTLVRRVVGNTWKLDVAFCYVVLALVVLKALPTILKRIKLLDIAILILLLFIVYLSSLWSVFPEIQTSIIIDILTSCLPVYLVCVAHRDDEKLYHYLEYAAIVMLITQAILIVFYQARDNASNDAHSQTVGYNTLFSCIVFLSSIKKHKHLLFSIVGLLCAFILILMSGTRGPILCVILYILFSALLGFKTINLKKMVTSVIGIISGLIIYLNWTMIISGIGILLNDIGYSNRILNKIQTSGFYSDTARYYLFEAAKKYIFENPWIGSGLANDRAIIKSTAYIAFGDVIGLYPHNVFLELFMQLGLPAGILISFWFLNLTRRLIIKNQSKVSAELMLMFFCVGFCPLLISGSYLTYSPLYALIGFFVAYFRRKSRAG